MNNLKNIQIILPALLVLNSNERAKMFNNWQNAVENKTDNMQMTEELEIEEVEPFTSDWLVSKAFIRAIIIAIVLLLILIIGIIPRILTFLVELGFVIYIAC